LADQADVDPIHGFSSAERIDIPHLDLFDRNLSKISEKEKIEHIKEMEHATLSADTRIKKIQKAEYEEVTNYVTLINSKGLDLEREGTHCIMSMMALAEDNNSSELGFEFNSARIYTDLDPIKIGMNAAKRATDNHIIASPRIQLIDDGLYPRGLGSAPFDDEGIPQKTTLLVKEGKLLSYLFDRYWSQKTGSQLTGNSVRVQISSPPSTSVSNLFMHAGPVSFEQLLLIMDNGFFINELMGVHMVDPVSGDFSLGASGMWIEKGKAVFPVKGVTISGSIHNLFSAVEELGDDLRFVCLN
jgi:PmbA protein